MFFFHYRFNCKEVKQERKLMDSKKQYLEENFIFVPERYYQVLFEIGLIDQMVKIIRKVNKQEKFCSKRLLFMVKCNTYQKRKIKAKQRNKPVSTQTNESDFNPIIISENELTKYQNE